MPYNTSHRKGFALDYWIVVILGILLSLGIAMSFSVGMKEVVVYGKDTWTVWRIMEHHLLRLIPGLVLFLAALLFPVRWYRRVVLPFFGLILVLLVAVLVQHLVLKGASRWLQVGGFRFQPSEFAKLALIWLVAWYVSVRGRWLHLFWRGLFPVIGAIGLLVVLVGFQPNLSTAGLLLMVALGLLFLAGVSFRHFLTLGGLALALGLVVYAIPAARQKVQQKFAHATRRLDMFTHPERNANLQYTYLGLSEGGLLGTGIGRSRIKIGHLSEADTDFVFAVIGEEMGLLGMWAVLLMYLILGWRAFAIAQRLQARNKDPLLYLTAAGIGLVLLVFPLAHMGVVLGLLPPTGQPLPFVSRGGSNLWSNLILVGILLRLHHVAQTGREVLP